MTTDTTDTARWLVVRTRSGKELDVADAFRERKWVPRTRSGNDTAAGHWELGDFRVPVCCMVETSLRHINGYDKHKGDERTAYAKPILRGYVFVALRNPNDPIYKALRDRGLILGVMGRMDARTGLMHPSYLTDAGVTRFRDLHASPITMDYDQFLRLADGQSSDDPRIRQRARMIAGWEFDVGDLVSAARGASPPMTVLAFTGHDTQARVLFRLFGKEVVQDVPIEGLRKAS